MIGLLLKDYYCLRSYMLKQLGLIVLLYVGLTIAMKSSAFFTPMMIMYVMITLISCFSLDDTTHWNSYALTLPLAPKTIVAARYLLFLIAMCIVAVFACTVSTVIDIVFFHQGIAEIWGSAAAVMLLYATICAFCLPLFFKFGAEKARIWMTLIMMLPFMGIMIFGGIFENELENFAVPSNEQIGLILLAAAFAVAVTCCISYCISVKLFTTKEF